ncbi:hypothetical protein ACF3VQ_05125 [Yersinia sp. HM-2024]|uniref:hypothetical protein n=1 Tax=Yersinia sp. HM-2024 TaxID=3344550 RepID=UPI00370DE1FA
MIKQYKKRFSLLELVLVLGVGTAMAFIKFQDMKNEREVAIANTVGAQIKQVGEAVMLSCQSGVWGSGGKIEVIYGSNSVCSANKIPVARYWTLPGGSNYGNYCTLQTGWAGVTCSDIVNLAT